MLTRRHAAGPCTGGAPRTMPGMTYLLIGAWLLRVIAIVLLVVDVWALIQALRFPPDAYTAASKRTKGFWLAMTGGAAVAGLLSVIGSSASLFMLIGIVIAGVFLADVRPALLQVMSRARYNRW